MRPREAVIFTNMCMIENASGQVLVQDRVDPAWPGLTFPGGHVEHDEDFADAVIREVWEETGLTIIRSRLCGIKHWRNDDGSMYIVLLYRTADFTGDMHDSEEGVHRWMSLDEMRQGHLAQSMGLMLDVFLDENISEMISRQTNDGEWTWSLK